MPRVQLQSISSSLSLSGTTQYSTLAAGTQLNYERTDSFSIAVWFKTSSSSAQSIVSKLDSSSPNRGYELFINTQKLQFFISSTFGTTHIGAAYDVALSSGVWHHGVLTYNGSGVAAGCKLYVDGISRTLTVTADTLGSNTIQIPTVKLSVGSRNNASQYFAGLIDDVRVYSRVLTADEVQTLSVGGEISSTSLTLWQRMDEGSGSVTTDSSGNGNSGTITGATYSSDVRFNNGSRQLIRSFGTQLKFDGTTAYVDYGTPANIAGIGSSSFTMNVWIKTSRKATRGNIFDIGIATTNNQGCSLYVHTDELLHQDLSNVAGTVGTKKITDGNWHMVSVTNNAGTFQLYVDGVADGGTAAMTPNITAGRVRNGSATNSVSLLYQGLMDDPRFYTRALSATELLNLYYGIEPATTNLISRWQFDEGSGTTATDSVGSNTGTITAATYVTDPPLGITTRSVAGSRISTGIDLNKCCSFNGSTSEITFTAPTSFDPANLTQFTCAFWAYPRVMTTATAARCIDFTPAAGAGFRLFLGNTGTVNGLRADVGYSVTGASKTSGNYTIQPGQWYRCLMTWNDADNTPTIYINGVSYNFSSQNKSGTRGNVSTQQMVIGRDNVLNNNGLDGLIDEVCLWNRVLTSQEISDDYFKGIVPTDSALILRYKMDEASGNLTDSSSSGLTGTPSNVTQNVTSYSTGTRTAVP